MKKNIATSSTVKPSTYALVSSVLLSSSALLLGLSAPAAARITALTITTTETPAFGGTSFGSVGQYERIQGTITGEVDPADPHNSVIVDIANAQKNADGMVGYTANFQIFRPIKLANGNHRVVFELPNRGGASVFSTLNDSTSGNSMSTAPTTAATAGNGFLMNQGFTIVEGAWDITAAEGGTAFGVKLPIAVNKDGSAITGRALEELVVDFSSQPSSLPLTYPAATPDPTQAQLTVRENYGDTPIAIPSARFPGLNWTYASSTSVQLTLDGTPVKFGATGTYSPTALYEFSYTAMNPIVAGLGLAAVRDLATFLRNAKTDDAGVPNPLAGDVQKIYTYCLSQPCRTTHDFVLLGFNDADLPTTHQKVFDGMMNWIGGANGEYLNYRFAQPTRTSRQHIARWYPEFQFPFANVSTTDPFTHQTNGRLVACEATNTCPNIFEVNSENEYYSKGGSQLTTDPQGHDLDLSLTPQVRYYLLSSLPHGAGTAAGICRQPQNPLKPNAVLRAMLLDLDAWATSNTAPPPNAVPQVSTHTLAPPLPQTAMGFPAIPGVYYNGILHTGDLFDFGPQFHQGILTQWPPILVGTPYTVLVPKTDIDGNDIAGIRLPDVSVPLATYTGYGYRAPYAGQPVAIVDGCDASGQRIPFPPTKASRQAGGANAGDPRLSLEERYPGGRQQYVNEVATAVTDLLKRRLLLPMDAHSFTIAAEAVTIP
jgi:hypothetical protein